MRENPVGTEGSTLPLVSSLHVLKDNETEKTQPDAASDLHWVSAVCRMAGVL